MRRDKRQRQDMIAAIDKGDRVVVNGAILGTVLQVDKGDEKDPDDKLVLKVDENSNLKMRVLRSSVTRVYKKDTSKDGA
jgi:preprotein translocase subunit YajC